MLRYYYQETLTNMPIYIPESDEIDWEMFIQDENDRENMANHPDIPKKAQSISKYGVQNNCEKPCIFEELYASDNITPVICIACGLLFFYGKMIIEYYLQKIDG